jgi:hypothetical protein
MTASPTGNMRYENGLRKIPAAARSRADAILQTPRALGTSVFAQPSVRFRAIIRARWFPKPDETVLTSAHLDSWDRGTGAVDGRRCRNDRSPCYGGCGQGLEAQAALRVVLYGAEEFGVHGGDDAICQAGLTM